jgi:hypothetical protein
VVIKILHPSKSKIDLIVIHDFMFNDVITILIGNSRAISASKIRKITAIRRKTLNYLKCFAYPLRFLHLLMIFSL